MKFFCKENRNFVALLIIIFLLGANVILGLLRYITLDNQTQFVAGINSVLEGAQVSFECTKNEF